MRQIILDFGVLHLGGLSLPLRIYGYGLMLVFGFIFGIALAQWRARRMGENPEILSYCGIWAMVGGIGGSRIAYIIQHWEEQFAHAKHPLAAMMDISSGGLIYYGGVIGAILLVVGYLLYKKRPVRRYLDILAVSMMIGLAFGRMGCLLNGCCYGGPCRADWPIAMHFPMYSEPLLKLDGRENPYSVGTEGPSPPYSAQLHREMVHPDPQLLDEDGQLIPPRELTPEQVAIAQASRSLAIQPAQLLGMTNALLLAGLLTLFFRYRKREGQVFLLMLVMYPMTRFVLESIRADNPHDLMRGVLTHNQYTSLITMFLALIALFLLRYLPASAGPTWAEQQAQCAAEPAGGVSARSSGRKNNPKTRRKR